MNADQVALHIRGEKDTMVHLTLERNSKWLEKNIRRQDYVTKTVESNILNAESSKVGTFTELHKTIAFNWGIMVRLAICEFAILISIP